MEFKILVVDDEEVVTGTLSEVFSDEGYQVTQAHSGDEAVAVVNREPPDLVVLDLKMPGMTGEEVLRHLKAKTPQVRSVVITAYPEREQGVRAIGCDAFIRKPFSMDDLVKTARSILARKDDDEMKAVTMPEEVARARPGEPLADILIFEPVREIAGPILYSLRYPDSAQGSGGVYHPSWAAELPQALTVMLAVHPDLVLVDLATLPYAAGVVRQLLDCAYQPKDYIFYFHKALPPDQEELVGRLPFKQWQGSPRDRKDLAELVELVRKTALEHGLVKR